MGQPQCKFKPGDVVVHKTSGKIVQILYPFSSDDRLAPYLSQSLPYYSCRIPDRLETVFIFYEIELDIFEERARA